MGYEPMMPHLATGRPPPKVPCVSNEVDKASRAECGQTHHDY